MFRRMAFAASVATFVGSLVVLGFVLFGRTGDPQKPKFFSVSPDFTVGPTLVATPIPGGITTPIPGVPSPTATFFLPTDTPTPSPKPSPFDGKVARMRIPNLKIDYPIEELGIIGDNELDVPHNSLGAIGWYKLDGYGKPGFGDENAVFSAHVNYRVNGTFQDGPFARLSQIRQGDEIMIQMQGGPLYTYKAISFKRYDLDSLMMGDIVWPPNRPSGQEWVTLITCSCEVGRWVPDYPGAPTGHCLDRDIVVAVRVK